MIPRLLPFIPEAEGKNCLFHLELFIKFANQIKRMNYVSSTYVFHTIDF